MYLIRGIIAVYLILFIIGIILSGIYLNQVIALHPIPLIGLLKYTLLCVLFLTLIVITIKAITLKPSAVERFAESVKNFKWLFAIMLIISFGFRLEIFDIPSASSVKISDLQLAVIGMLSLFCFWSDKQLNK